MTNALRSRPSRGTMPAWKFPSFERVRLPNGLTLLSCHVPDRPLAELRLVLGGGLRQEPSDMAGLSAVASSAVLEGTADRSAEEYALALETLGAELQVSPDWDALVAGMSVPVTRLRDALSLAVEAVGTPAFRDEDIERVARTQRGELELMRRMPEPRRGIAFRRSVFLGTSRMAWPSEGTTTGLERVTPNAVRRFWEAHVVPQSTTLIVVGDLRGTALEEAVESSFGRWSGLEPEAPMEGSADRPAPTAGIDVVDVPGAPQSVLAVGEAFDPVPVEERPALDVAVNYLGGFFGSRLNTVLREEKQVAYGASAGLDHRATATVLVAQTSVQSDATAEAVLDMVEEIRALAAAALDAPSLADSIDFLVRSRPVMFTNVGVIAYALTNLVTRGLPDDFPDMMQRAIQEVSAERAAAAFARFVDTSRLRIVAVGDAGAIAEPLERLQLAPVEVEPMA